MLSKAACIQNVCVKEAANQSTTTRKLSKSNMCGKSMGKVGAVEEQRGELHLADACHGNGDGHAGQDGAAIICILDATGPHTCVESLLVASRRACELGGRCVK